MLVYGHAEIILETLLHRLIYLQKLGKVIKQQISNSFVII